MNKYLWMMVQMLDIHPQDHCKAGRQFHYNQAGRLETVTHNGQTIANYVYNAFNQRVLKTTRNKTTRFVYDLQGMMIQESANDDNTDIIWLDGQAVLQASNGTDTYIINDHLNTPRVGLNQQGKTTWQWRSDGFGNTEPVNDPDGNGEITEINLRFPGQYADKETGLYYNWNRYYDPETGRYVTSDPIGLLAGVNTYGYVGGNPINSDDRSGLYESSRADGLPDGFGSMEVRDYINGGTTRFSTMAMSRSSNFRDSYLEQQAVAAVAAPILVGTAIVSGPGVASGGVAGSIGAASTSNNAFDIVVGGTVGMVAGGIPVKGTTYNFGANFVADLLGKIIGQGGNTNDLNFSQALGSGLGGAAGATRGVGTPGIDGIAEGLGVAIGSNTLSGMNASFYPAE